jgi:hypothetical protein
MQFCGAAFLILDSVLQKEKNGLRFCVEYSDAKCVKWTNER